MGRRRRRQREEEAEAEGFIGDDEIKKGPWKAEEDEVLISHVNKHGPRDWSSIRSKGLLHRTGKSCRLRWVNKLRPNLKNGIKFSAEEERIVMELQAEFGNKWARIATYLPGRTDNDVKNFWSSRQKRLARLLQTPAPSPLSQYQNPSEVSVVHDMPTDMEAPKFSSSTDEESSSKSQSCSSLLIDNSQMMIKMVPLPELAKPDLLHCEQDFLQPEFNPAEKNPAEEPQAFIPFPIIPDLEPDLPLEMGSQELASVLGSPNLLEMFGNADASDVENLPQIPLVPPYLGDEGQDGREDNGNSSIPDSFFSDFPADVFGHIEPLPSPSDW